MLTKTMSNSKSIIKYILFLDLLIIWKETGFQFIKVLPGAQINIQQGWGKEFCLPPSPPKYLQGGGEEKCELYSTIKKTTVQVFWGENF